MNTDVSINLITGSVRVNSLEEQKRQDSMTAHYKSTLGECDGDYACMWTKEYGWVPEAGCPVHD